MPNSKPVPTSLEQQAQAQYKQAKAHAAQIQYRNMLLQNSYNPYAQSTYVSNMAQTLEDWQLEKTFCINGNWMNLEEFVNFLYPEHCAEKTYLILKLKGQKNEDNS